MAMALDRKARYPVEGWGCTLKDFWSHNFNNLDGSADHFSTENWLNYIGELLDTIGCTIEQKVR
jgi:hypothetical protein